MVSGLHSSSGGVGGGGTGDFNGNDAVADAGVRVE